MLKYLLAQFIKAALKLFFEWLEDNKKHIKNKKENKKKIKEILDDPSPKRRARNVRLYLDGKL